MLKDHEGSPDRIAYAEHWLSLAESFVRTRERSEDRSFFLLEDVDCYYNLLIKEHKIIPTKCFNELHNKKDLLR
jgi:hypothetical protein